jgi:hypothetical protein
MFMFRIRSYVLGAALIVSTAQAGAAQQAGTLRWSGTGDSFVSSFKETNGTVEAGYAGAAYRAQLQINSSSAYLPPHGTSAFGPVVDIYCIDFLHNANQSSTGYAANFTNLGADALGATRSADLDRYLKAAYLINKMDEQDFSAGGKQARVDIHAAIWNIMAGQPTMGVVGYTSTFDSQADDRMLAWIGEANASYSTVDRNLWTVVTAACVTSSGTNGDGSAAADGCGQEFMTRSPMVTPEPATIVLLATGLLVVFGAGVAGRSGFLA